MSCQKPSKGESQLATLGGRDLDVPGNSIIIDNFPTVSVIAPA
jgi:hypothetical protein